MHATNHCNVAHKVFYAFTSCCLVMITVLLVIAFQRLSLLAFMLQYVCKQVLFVFKFCKRNSPFSQRQL